MDYYCIECGIRYGVYHPALPEDLTGTQYQLEKYMKHTVPTTPYPFNSVFTDPSTVAYRDFVVTAVSSGHVQVDDLGRTNLVWMAGRTTGASYLNGIFEMDTDSVKVVFHDDQFKIHAFPAVSAGVGAYCSRCGRPLPGVQ